MAIVLSSLLILHSLQAVQGQVFIAELGSRRGLVCNATYEDDDPISLLLWYRDEEPEPFYWVDARSVSVSQARHQTSVADRIYLDVAAHPPALFINPVRPEDGGHYRCRVDFRNDRTYNSAFDLMVVGAYTLMRVCCPVKNGGNKASSQRVALL